MSYPTVAPEQKVILDLTKLEKLVQAEQISIEYSREQGIERKPFLARFLRDIENDPMAVNYFTRGGGDDSKNARAIVEGMDLSNIKNEVLAAIYIFYTQASAWRQNFPYQNPVSTLSRLSTGKNDIVTQNILYTKDAVGTALFQHPSSSIATFDYYLKNYPEQMSSYITGYLDSFVILNNKSKEGEYFSNTDPKTWNYYSSYTPKGTELIEKILAGKKGNPVLKLFTTSGEPEWDTTSVNATGHKIRR